MIMFVMIMPATDDVVSLSDINLADIITYIEKTFSYSYDMPTGKLKSSVL